MLITEDNAVFISSLLDPHAEHLVNLLMKSQWLGDILSQGQIVPLHYAPPRRHIVPTDAPSPVTFCPTFSI